MAGNNGPIPGSGTFGPAPGVPRLSDFSSSGGVSMRDVQGRFTKGGWGFAWSGLDTVVSLPDRFEQFLMEAAEQGVRSLAAEIEEYAKTNAPWEDRTGDARTGLKTVVAVGNGKFAIYLGHSVYYGMYLENSNGGAYAIIVPTLRQYAPQLAQVIGMGGS